VKAGSLQSSKRHRVQLNPDVFENTAHLSVSLEAMSRTLRGANHFRKRVSNLVRALGQQLT
jgi:hypothetical protein